MLIGYRKPARRDSAIKGLFNGGFKGAWYDFSDVYSMCSDTAGTRITPGGTVAMLLDKSGNGNNFSQAASGPTWNSGGYVSFNGSSQYIQMTVGANQSALGFSPGGFLTPDWTFLGVVSAPSIAISTYLWSLGSSSTSAPVISFASYSGAATTSSGFVRPDSATGGFNTAQIFRTNSLISTRQFIGLSMTGDLATLPNRFTSYIDDVSAIHNSSATMIGTYTMDRFTLGALGRNGAPTGFCAYNLYQFLLINRVLSRSEVIKVKSYWSTLIN